MMAVVYGAAWVLSIFCGNCLAQVWKRTPSSPFIVAKLSRVQLTWLYEPQGKDILFQKFGASTDGTMITEIYVRIDASGVTVLRPEIADFQLPGNLILKNVTHLDNSKVIACEVEIKERPASDFSSTRLQVLDDSPSFITGLPPKSTYKDGDVNTEFKVQVYSTILPQVMWLLNGVPLPQNTEFRVEESTVTINNKLTKQSVLRIALIKPTHQGILTARATLVDGGAPYDSSAEIEVNYSPRGVITTSNVTSVPVGGFALISCTAESQPTSRLSIFKGLQSFGEVAGRNISLPFRITDQFTVFSCQATNSIGSARSSNVTVEGVFANRPLFRQQLPPKFEFQILDRTKRFQVKVAGNPIPKAVWLLNGVALSPGNGFYIEDENVSFNGEIVAQSTLTISEIQTEHAGELKARAFFYQGAPIYDSTSEILVYYKPRQLQFDSNATRVPHGGYVKLTCSAQAYPLPTYNITLDQKTISNSLVGSVIVQLTGNHAYATFRCSATNMFGFIESNDVQVLISYAFESSAWPQVKDSNWWKYYVVGVAVVTFVFFGFTVIACTLRRRMRKLRIRHSQSLKMKEWKEKESKESAHKAESSWNKPSQPPINNNNINKNNDKGNILNDALDGGLTNYSYDYKNGGFALDY